MAAEPATALMKPSGIRPNGSRHTVKITIISLSGIRVRMNSPNETIDNGVVLGSNGAFEEASTTQRSDICAASSSCTPHSDAQSSPQHLFDQLGVSLSQSCSPRHSTLQKPALSAEQDPTNFSVSAAVSFSGSFPPESMQVLSSSVCLETGRLIVESEPVLKYGEDIADRGVSPPTMLANGKFEHKLMATWDPTPPIDTVSPIETGASDGSEGAISSASSRLSSKSRRRRSRTAAFRISRSISTSQAHMTALLTHRPETVDNLCDENLNVMKSTFSSDNELKASGTARSSLFPTFEETDRSKSPKSLGIQCCKGEELSLVHVSSAMGDRKNASFDDISQGKEQIIQGSRASSSLIPINSPSSGTSGLPDIIEINVHLFVGREMASNVDGDSGGAILSVRDTTKDALDPIGGVAHVVLYGNDLASEGSHTLDLPVRTRAKPFPSSDSTTPAVHNTSHPIVDLGGDATIRIMVEVSADESMISRDTRRDNLIEWTFSGSSTIVREAVEAGKEEADGADIVSIERLMEAGRKADCSESNLDADGNNAGVHAETDIFCGGFSVFKEIFSRQSFLRCVDTCDDNAMVYAAEDNNSMASTIDTVYSKIVF